MKSTLLIGQNYPGWSTARLIIVIHVSRREPRAEGRKPTAENREDYCCDIHARTQNTALLDIQRTLKTLLTSAAAGPAKIGSREPDRCRVVSWRT